MGQITETGYKLKTPADYFSEEKALYEDIDSEWNLDPATPDGLKIAHDAEVFSALDQAIKQAYDARDPNKATGSDLDVLRALTGSVRNMGTPTRVMLKLTGVAGTAVPAGSRVKNSDGLKFKTTDVCYISLDGIGTVEAKCEENGAIEVSANSVTSIVDVISGWQTVTNPNIGVLGTAPESDTAFRLRSAKAVARASVGIKESLYGEIFAVDGVLKVQIYENRTNSSASDPKLNPHSLPPHSIAIVVDGGDADDVARAIFNKLSVGVNMTAVGTKVEKKVNSLAYPKSYDIVTFGRPVDVPISISIEYADPYDNCPDETTLQNELAEAYLEYNEGSLIPDGIGFKTSGFDIGESVPYSRLFTPSNKVLGNYEGAYVSKLMVNGGTSNVAVAYDKVARFSKSKITIKKV